MEKQDFLKGMTILGLAYNKEFSEEQVGVWYSMLKDYTTEELSNAIQELIKTEERIPSIATITKKIAEQKTKTLPQAEDEWNKVLNVVHKYGSWNQQKAMDSLKPYTAYIVSHVGYQNICMSTDNTWNKKEFIAEYEQMKDKEVENLQLGEAQDLKMLQGIKMLGEWKGWK